MFLYLNISEFKLDVLAFNRSTSAAPVSLGGERMSAEACSSCSARFCSYLQSVMSMCRISYCQNRDLSGDGIDLVGG